MTLTSQLPAPPGWGRWQQHDADHDYVMVGSSMMVSSGPLQRPIMASHYTVDTQYTAPPALSSMAASHFPPPFSFGPFAPSLPAVVPLHAESTQHHQHHYGQPRPQHHRQEYHDHGHGHGHDHQQQQQQQQYHHNPQDHQQQPVPSRFSTTVEPRSSFGLAPKTKATRSTRRSPLRSPVIKHEDETTSAQDPQTINDDVSAEKSAGAGNQVEFHTAIDNLMKIIQSRPETDRLITATGVNDGNGTNRGQKFSKYFCRYPGCERTFQQKTQLDTHHRSHTGEKPYPCRFEGCTKRFSQVANLSTHMRLHRGEKPYECGTCRKRFAQSGNLSAHMRTHMKVKQFVCKLENCNKEFTQRGALKYHQVRFHIGYIQQLGARITSAREIETLPEEDIQAWAYLAPLYKNLNKGIKGRGMGCHVERVGGSSSSSRDSSKSSPTSPTSCSDAGSSPSPSMVAISPSSSLPSAHHNTHGAFHAVQQQHHHHHHQEQASYQAGPFSAVHRGRGLMHPSANYGDMRPALGSILHLVTPGVGGSSSSLTPSSSPSTTIYSDDSTRGGELAFGDRIY